MLMSLIGVHNGVIMPCTRCAVHVLDCRVEYAADGESIKDACWHCAQERKICTYPGKRTSGRGIRSGGQTTATYRPALLAVSKVITKVSDSDKARHKCKGTQENQEACERYDKKMYLTGCERCTSAGFCKVRLRSKVCLQSYIVFW